MRGSIPSAPLALVLIATLAACGEPRPTTAPAPALGPRAGAAAPLFFEEELIGDPIYGTTVFYQHADGRDYALYKMTIEPTGGSMYYNGHQVYNKWGWFTTKNPDCAVHSEVHDTDGDGIVDSGGLEQHCIPNGGYTITVVRRYFTGAQLDSQRVIFTRHVALLDTLGAQTENPSSHDYHDTRVAFDLDSATTTLSGGIRAGHYYQYISDTSQYYPLVRTTPWQPATRSG